MPEKNFTPPPIDFRAAFEATPCNSALVLANAPEYTILAATAGFLKNSNAVKEQLVGKGIFDCFPSNPDDKTDTGAAQLRDSFAWVIQHKKTHELPAQRYDVADEKGVYTERYWKSVNEPVLNAAGEVAYIIHSAEEVTQQIKAKKQESYIKDMEQMHKIFMQAPVAIHIFKGRDLVIEMANEPTLKLWGKTADVIGKKLSDVFPDAPIGDYIKELHHVMDSGKVHRVFERQATIEADGKFETVYLNCVFQPYYENDEPKATGILAWLNNVTERVLSEKAFHESEMRFQQIANTLPLVVWTASPDGNITFISEQWEKLYGNPRSESLGAGWVSFLHPDDVAHSGGKWAQALHSGIDYETEFRVHSKDGNYRWVLVRAVPIKDGAGNIMSWYGSNTDIHSQRETEQQNVTAQEIARKQIEEVIAERTRELAEANANLQRSNAELAQFAYIASHDLQEPLRKISVFAQMLGKHLTNNIDAQTQNFLVKIDSSVSRMINLVRDVLVYSELTKQTDIFIPVDLQEISEGVKTDFELLIEQREATIEFSGLPVIEAIPLQMSQLFGNLVSNALKFSREDTKPVITVNARVMKKDELAAYPSADRDALYYHIEFRDNGIGFSAEYSEQIFNIFQRLHGRSAYSGTGIGLAMCRKIVQNHHGYISAEGDQDGAVFSVVLPAKQ